MASSTRRFVRSLTFARPANTTAYTAADAVSDNATSATVATFTLKGMAPQNHFGGVIQSIVLHKDDQDLTAADFDIYFFDTAVVNTGFEDNAAIAITDAEWKTCVGGISLTASANGANVATGDIFVKNGINMAYQCAAGSTDLYVVIVARAAYTPASGETFTLRVFAEVE